MCNQFFLDEYADIVRRPFYLADGTKEQVHRYLRKINGVYSVTDLPRGGTLWFVECGVSKDLQNMMKQQEQTRARGRKPTLNNNHVPSGACSHILLSGAGNQPYCIYKNNNRIETNKTVNRQLFCHEGNNGQYIPSPTPLPADNGPHNSNRYKVGQYKTARQPYRYERQGNP